MRVAAADIDASIVSLSARLGELVQLRAEMLRRELAAADRKAARGAAHRGLTIEEAAASSGLSRSTVRRLVLSGAIKAYGGRVRRILPEALAAYMGRTKQQEADR